MTAYPTGTTPAMTAGYAPAYTPPVPQPPSGAPAPPSHPVPPGPPMPGVPRRPRRNLIGLISAVLVAGLIGGGVGAFIMSQTSHVGANAAPSPAAPPPTAAQVQDANMRLCTAYATANAALPKPQRSALDVLPVVNAYKWALEENPNASPDIRNAIANVIEQFEGQMASFGEVRTRGFAQPPAWNVADAQAAVDHAWAVCQLG